MKDFNRFSFWSDFDGAIASHSESELNDTVSAGDDSNLNRNQDFKN
jgi:hypothetical protein